MIIEVHARPINGGFKGTCYCPSWGLRERERERGGEREREEGVGWGGGREVSAADNT